MMAPPIATFVYLAHTGFRFQGLKFVGRCATELPRKTFANPPAQTHLARESPIASTREPRGDGGQAYAFWVGLIAAWYVATVL